MDKTRDKVSIILNGGMCNYMFQIAAAYAYSLKYNKQFVVNTKNAIRIQRPIESYKDNIFRKVFEFDSDEKFDKFKVYNEVGFHYNEIPYIDGDVIFNGYWQSELYFKEYEKEIRELFSFPEEMVNEIKEKYKDLLEGETCSIHIRRGDYVHQPMNHPVQNLNYYMKSIKKIGINKTFLVFSDNISYCKEEMFPDMDNLHYINGQNDYEDLLLMNLCSDNIICNSSFSWWAAWLNLNSNKKVIAPNNWFGNSLSAVNDTKDLYCENWIKI